MTQIDNEILIDYNKGMSKSILDKIFFIDKLDKEDNINTLVDFGCADGTLISKINALFNDFKFYGYDINAKMIELAQQKCEYGKFSDDWNELINDINVDCSVLNISSVLHEIYTYCSKAEIADFWNKVFNSGFKYISIRDLMISNSTIHSSDINNLLKIINNPKIDKNLLQSFTSRWGSLYQNENLVHYLCKYRYVSNWERENEENYFALKLEQFLQKIPIDKYEIVWYNHYTLSYLKQKVKSDFDIDLTDNTHMKILLRKKD